MRIHRGLLFWGLGFVVAGLVALAIQVGYLDRTAMAGAWRLWPLILVALGISLLASRTPFAVAGTIVAAVVLGATAGTAIAIGPGIASDCGGSGPSSLQDHSGSLGASATLDWRLDCGTLDVSTTAGSTWRASVGSTAGNAPTVDAASDRLSLQSANEGGFFADHGQERWVVTLPSPVTYDADMRLNASKGALDLHGTHFSVLALQPNAADLTMNLAGASIDGFDLEMNAGSLSISADASTTLSGKIQMNAGSVSFCAPAGAALRITASGTAFGTNLGDTDLTRSGDTWESPTYAAASQRITLTVHGNAASFDLNPSGECQ